MIALPHRLAYASLLACALALSACGDKTQLTATEDCLRDGGARRQSRPPAGLARAQVLDARRLGDTGLVGEVIAARDGPVIALANQALRDDRKVLRLQSVWRPPAGTDARALLTRCAR